MDLSTPWRECIEQAWEAYLAGSLPIGAVITNKDGRIVAHGRNRLFETAAPAPYVSNIRMAHAEMNALLAFSESGEIHEETTLYTSLEPCPMCLGATRMYRIGAIAYAARDSIAGSIHLIDASHFIQINNFAIHHPPDPDLEQVLLALLTESVLRLTPGTWVEWREKEPANRPSIKLGRKLLADNAFQRYHEERASIWDIFPNLVMQIAAFT